MPKTSGIRPLYNLFANTMAVMTKLGAVLVSFCLPISQQTLAIDLEEHSPCKLVIADWHNTKPYRYLDSGEVTGISIDIYNAVFASIDCEIDIRYYNSARGRAKLTAGEVDIFPYFLTKNKRKYDLDNSQFILASEPLYISRAGLFSRNDRRIVIEKSTDLLQYSVGTVRVTQWNDRVWNMLFGVSLRRVPYKDYTRAVQGLLAGRVDLILGPAAMSVLSKDYGHPKLSLAYELPPVRVALVFSKLTLKDRASKLAKKIDQEIKKMKADGRIKAILMRHADEDAYITTH